MKVNRKDLADALKYLVKIANGHPVMPILDSVLLQASGNTLTATANNLNDSLTFTMPCTDDIAVCINAKMLNTLVKGYPTKGDAGSVEFGAIEDGKIPITVDDMTTKLVIGVAEDFPNVVLGKWEQVLSLSFKDKEEHKAFVQDFKYVAAAMGNDPTRFSLQTLAFDADRMVATDGHRLHLAKLPVSVLEPVLFKRETVALLESVLNCCVNGLVVETCTVEEDKMMRVQFLSGFLVAKCQSLYFPNFEQAIPNDFKYIVKINSKLLKKALARVSALAANNFMTIKINKSFTILTDDLDVGSTETTVSVEFERHAKDDLKIGLNPNLLQAAIALDDQEVTLSFEDDSSPVRVDFGAGQMAIVMPKRA